MSRSSFLTRRTQIRLNRRLLFLMLLTISESIPGRGALRDRVVAIRHSHRYCHVDEADEGLWSNSVVWLDHFTLVGARDSHHRPNRHAATQAAHADGDHSASICLHIYRSVALVVIVLHACSSLC